VLSGVDRRARIGGFEAEVCKCRQSVCCCARPRNRRRAADCEHAELALQLIGNASGQFWTDAVGTADHRFVFLRHGAREFFGREHREDRQREAAAHALNRRQRAERITLDLRTEAEQRPGILSDLQFGEYQDIAADGPERVERSRACLDDIPHAANIDHRAVAGGFGEFSGQSGDHHPQA
jgi:hypothetical protein